MRKLLRKGFLLYVVVFLMILVWWRHQNGRFSRTVIQNTFASSNHAVQRDRQQDLSMDISGTPRPLSDLIPGFEKGDNISRIRTKWSWIQDSGDSMREITSVDLELCSKKFIAYRKSFAKLVNVTIDPTYGTGRKGGENVSEVFNQKEDDEYYKLNKGYFKLPCDDANAGLDYVFNGKSHLNTWLGVTNFTKDVKYTSSISQWTIAVLRYEYANLYHTMTDYYNAFLVAKAFSLDPNEIIILFVDGHPIGALDSSWKHLFKKFIRAGDITLPTRFNSLVWNIMGYQSFLNTHSRSEVPYLEEFREFFLSRHGVLSKSSLNCNKLNILFLWRRDYIAHPRNPSGTVSRKIKNEDELITKVKQLLPEHNVYGVQLDTYPMKKQLFLISRTDILIGMHGAGLSHTLFLPKHAGLIELYPVYWSTANEHFKAMARWRGLKYLSWVNRDSKRELPNKYTLVDEGRVTDLVKQMKSSICL